MAWDERSGARERLYWLTRMGLSADPSGWIYNSITDRWSNGQRGFHVEVEAAASRKVLYAAGNTKEQVKEAIQ